MTWLFLLAWVVGWFALGFALGFTVARGRLPRWSVAARARREHRRSGRLR